MQGHCSALIFPGATTFVAKLLELRTRQRDPAPHRRYGSRQRLHYGIGLMQVNLVAAPRRGDVHTVGTEEIETSLGPIARLALGFCCGRTVRQYNYREISERRRLAGVRLLELLEEFPPPRQERLGACLGWFPLFPKAHVKPQADRLQVGRQPIERLALARWRGSLLNRRGQRVSRPHLVFRQIPNQIRLVFCL